MGSLESGLSLKRDQPLLRSSSATKRKERHPFGQRPRSRFARLFLFKKIDYLQWTCTVTVFFFFLVLFQMFLPGSVMEKSKNSWRGREVVAPGDLMLWKEIGGLDFGEDIKFEPSKLLAKFQKESNEVNLSSVSRRGVRFGYRKPQLALVFPDLLVDPQQILMVTVAGALREIGYQIEVKPLNHSHALPPPGKKGRTYICSCMIYLRPTSGAKLVMKKWIEELQAQPWSKAKKSNDQPAFNWALNKTAGQVDLYLLPQAAFPTGGLYFKNQTWVQETKGMHVIIHNNYIVGFDKKIKRFHDFGLWLVDDHAHESPLGRL